MPSTGSELAAPDARADRQVDARLSLDPDRPELIAGNGLIERRWSADAPDLLAATSLRDMGAGVEWLRAGPHRAALAGRARRRRRAGRCRWRPRRSHTARGER
jgi:hypothetical protein